jgi:hypothetical protein
MYITAMIAMKRRHDEMSRQFEILTRAKRPAAADCKKELEYLEQAMAVFKQAQGSFV